MFMKKKFILGVLCFSAATAQGQPGGMVIGDVIFFAQPSVATETPARVEGRPAGDEGVVRVDEEVDGLKNRQIGDDGVLRIGRDADDEGELSTEPF